MEVDLDLAVERVLEGDREAFREIIEVCEARVRMVLAAALPDPAMVEDLAQEVFITAYTRLNTYSPGTDFSAWIKRIARNLARNERRNSSRRKRCSERYARELEHGLERRVDELSRALGNAALQALRECLDAAHGQVRQLLYERYDRNMSSDEIGRKRGRRAGWARLVLHRARLELAECLRRKGQLGLEPRNQ